ncbi:MAG TPA: glycine cleavage system protein GcvH [Candidatus Dormibacteraeota bacterium]|nr:glycine cleavage system protein GcvH [Candidatus Dormibacteraeota bacterium]
MTGYRFSQTHEWVKESGSAATIGITEYAQSQLGDVVYVELPGPGTEISAGAKFGVVESVKAASDLYSPVAGKVVEANPQLAEKPELINQEPYGQGWMLKIELAGPVSGGLLDEAAYLSFTEGL